MTKTDGGEARHAPSVEAERLSAHEREILRLYRSGLFDLVKKDGGGWSVIMRRERVER